MYNFVRSVRVLCLGAVLAVTQTVVADIQVKNNSGDPVMGVVVYTKKFKAGDQVVKPDGVSYKSLTFSPGEERSFKELPRKSGYDRVFLYVRAFSVDDKRAFENVLGGGNFLADARDVGVFYKPVGLLSGNKTITIANVESSKSKRNTSVFQVNNDSENDLWVGLAYAKKDSGGFKVVTDIANKKLLVQAGRDAAFKVLPSSKYTWLFMWTSGTERDLNDVFLGGNSLKQSGSLFRYTSPSGSIIRAIDVSKSKKINEVIINELGQAVTY